MQTPGRRQPVGTAIRTIQGGRPLKPSAHACDELRIAWISAGRAYAVCGSSELARPNDPGIGRELAPYLVSKTQTDLKVG
jgi:hypothetical protein